MARKSVKPRKAKKPKKTRKPAPQPLFGEPVFNEGVATTDPSTFRTTHPSDGKIYAQIQSLLTESTVSFPTARGNPGDLYALATALGDHGPGDVAAIEKAGQIVFQVAGDTGASSAKKYNNELSVSDYLTNEFQSAAVNNRPAFLFHLGDVVYDFCESQYWYDQFYEPFRNYAAPIFAIPGNHDSFIVPKTPAADAPLKIFMRNFCAAEPAVTPEAGSLHRTAMTQPGAYFTLDAPFVRIIGLFSNALEDPGLISSQEGQTPSWPGVPDVQLAYLAAQLAQIKKQKYAGAVILAVHHPPFSYSAPPAKGGAGGIHGGNLPMLAEIDTICKAQGVYPHAILSGHAHNFQSYTRTVDFNGITYTVPFLVCGNGGHNVTALVTSQGGQKAVDPKPGADVSYLDSAPAVGATKLTIDSFDHTNYGYLRVTVSAKHLRIDYVPVGTSKATAAAGFTTTVDIASHTATHT
jgi:hypothetical protein